MRLSKHKTCAACLWYEAAKQTANGVIDGEFFCRHAANSHKSKGTAFSIVRQIVNIADKVFEPDFVGCDEDIPLCGSQYKRIHFKCTPLQDY